MSFIGDNSRDAGEETLLDGFIVTAGNAAGIYHPCPVRYSQPDADQLYHQQKQCRGDGGAPDHVDIGAIERRSASLNHAPTFDPVADRTAIAEDSDEHTLTLTGIGDGDRLDQAPLEVSATSSDPTVIPNPAVTQRRLGPRPYSTDPRGGG